MYSNIVSSPFCGWSHIISLISYDIEDSLVMRRSRIWCNTDEELVSELMCELFKKALDLPSDSIISFTYFHVYSIWRNDDGSDIGINKVIKYYRSRISFESIEFCSFGWRTKIREILEIGTNLFFYLSFFVFIECFPTWLK